MFFSIPEIIVIALVLGVLVGLINGLLIPRLNVAPFIAKLGTLDIARGAATIFDLPVSIWLHRCRPGGGLFFALDADGAAHLRGGGNERAAALSGIRVNRAIG